MKNTKCRLGPRARAGGNSVCMLDIYFRYPVVSEFQISEILGMGGQCKENEYLSSLGPMCIAYFILEKLGIYATFWSPSPPSPSPSPTYRWWQRARAAGQHSNCNCQYQVSGVRPRVQEVRCHTCITRLYNRYFITIMYCVLRVCVIVY